MGAVFGVRVPGRAGHSEASEAQLHEGDHRIVVDVDLEKFVDRVNHDLLMDRLAKRIADKRVLRPKVNEAKTAVAPVCGHKFPGYCFWASKDGAKRTVASQALDKLRERIRRLTRRTRGRNLEQIAEDSRGYVPGWKAYFRLAQTPKVLRELDEWLGHRLRAVQFKQWRRETTMFRALRMLGASVDQAARIAGNGRRRWRTSTMGLNRFLPRAYFDRLGVPRFS